MFTASYNSSKPLLFEGFYSYPGLSNQLTVPSDFQEKAEALQKSSFKYICPVLYVTPATAATCTVTWSPLLPTSTPLSDYIHKHKIHPIQSVHLMKQGMYALSSLHGLGVLHGNISPDTVRVDSDGDILLAGIQFQYELTGSEDTELRMDYLAPEANSTYTEASDVYSLGKVFLYIATEGAIGNMQRVEFRSLSVYQLIQKMTEKDHTKRLQLKQYSHDFLRVEADSIAETAAIPSPAFPQISSLLHSLADKDFKSITNKLKSDYDFLLRTRNPLSRLYEQLVALLKSIKKDEESSLKLSESEQCEARKAGSSALKAALLYQQTKLYDYAKYCYSRALLAYHLAGELVEGESEGMQHYLEVRRGKAACYASLAELEAREI